MAEAINLAILCGSYAEIGKVERDHIGLNGKIASCLQYNHNQASMSSSSLILTVLSPLSRNIEVLCKGCAARS